MAILRFKRATAARWQELNPLLLSGEPGYEKDTGQLKIGDGVLYWNDLSYLSGSGGSPIILENVDDRVNELLVAGNGIDLNYDDEEDTLTITNTKPIVAPQWTVNHTLADGTRYLAGDVVWDNGNIFVAKFDNESLPTSNTTYWQNLGSGNRLNIDGRDIPNLPTGANTGDISFSGIQIIGSGTGSSDGNNKGTIELVPDLSLKNNDQYLIVDPTVPNHIHLRAGGSELYQGSEANLIIGGEYIHLSVSDMVQIKTKPVLVPLGFDAPGSIVVSTVSEDGLTAQIESCDGGGQSMPVVPTGDMPTSIGYIFIDGVGVTATNVIVGGNCPLEITLNPSFGKTFTAGNTYVVENHNYTYSDDNVWSFTEGNLNLPEGRTINWGQNQNTLGPPCEGGCNDRIRLWDFKGTGSDFNYAIGVEGNHMWFSMDVNDGTGGFKFYSRDDQIFKISDDSRLIFPNASTISEGSYINGTNGNYGISLNCAVGYELNWQGGHLQSTMNDGADVATIYVDSPIKVMQVYPTVSNLEFASGSGGSIETDASLGQIFDITIGNDMILENPINSIDGITLRWRITQNAVGGHTVTLGDKFTIPSSASNPLPWSTAANKTDLLAATYHAGRDKWDIIAFVPGY